MNKKILNLLLIISSFFGYLEWGTDTHTFLVQAEAEILTKLFSNPESVVHPFTLLPLAGQLALVISLFQKQVSKALSFTGIACIGILLAFMFVIGILSANWKILLSTLPFLLLSILTIRQHLSKS